MQAKSAAWKQGIRFRLGHRSVQSNKNKEDSLLHNKIIKLVNRFASS